MALKLGICSLAQDCPFQRFWRRGLMSASLLAFTRQPTAAGKALFERLMPEICDSGGVNRITTPGRFTGLDAAVQECLATIFPPGFSLRVQDWAVSSGITAAEWFTVLRQNYPDVDLTASDRLTYLVEARLPETGETYIVEPDGAPLQYIRPPFVLSLVQSQHWLYPVNRILQRSALRNWREALATRLRIPAEWHDSEDPGVTSVEAPPFVLRRLPLVHPDATALCGERFHIRTHSVFEPAKHRAHVIRTMNILNRAYFTDDQLQDAAVAVETSLDPGGVWIVGRTLVEPPFDNHVTVFRKCDDGWETLLRIGAGSEMEPIVASLSGTKRLSAAASGPRRGRQVG
ncbi:MAG TPA: hypothetical protein VN442_02540 [Bryobacteraceae bacterium]|nr:hypothetical protein [Bryobacteraceae bacterium]